MIVKKEKEIGGRLLSIETGRVARQASGAVLVRYGDTMVLAVANGEQTPREGIDFMPLSVECRKKPMPPERSREAFSNGKAGPARRKFSAPA